MVALVPKKLLLTHCTVCAPRSFPLPLREVGVALKTRQAAYLSVGESNLLKNRLFSQRETAPGEVYLRARVTLEWTLLCPCSIIRITFEDLLMRAAGVPGGCQHVSLMLMKMHSFTCLLQKGRKTSHESNFERLNKP